MRKIFFTTFMTLFGGIVWGHPGEFEKISYDPELQVLTVLIKHDITHSSVKDSSKHYIKQVSLVVAGKKGETKNHFRQETPLQLAAVFKIRLKKGDKVELSAICNMKGETKATDIIP